MTVLMKKNDANSVKGLKEMVEAAFRDLQTGAEQPDLGRGSGVATPTDGKHVAPVSTRGHAEMATLAPVITSHSRPHPSIRSGKRISASTHRETFCPTGMADTPRGDSTKGVTVKGKCGLENGPLRRCARRTPTGGRDRSPRKQRPGRECRAHTAGRRAGKAGPAFTGRELRCCSFQRSRIAALLLHACCLLCV